MKLDTAGVGVGVSTSINENLFLIGSFANGDAKTGALKINQDAYDVGLGGRAPLGPKTDFVGTLSYASVKLSALGASETVTGYRVGLGLRHELVDKLELNGGLGYSVLGENNDRTTALSVGLRYKFADQFSGGLGFTSANNDAGDSRSVNVSLRLEF